MRRTAYYAAAALACVAAATSSSCSSLDGECVLASARGAPAWVAQFSAAAAGPEQFHVSYGATPDAAAVRWATANASATATVRWGTSASALTHVARGKTDRYVYSAKYTSPWLHTTNLTGLPLGARIFLPGGRCGHGVQRRDELHVEPRRGRGVPPVSYTHLTLPTIYSV